MLGDSHPELKARMSAELGAMGHDALVVTKPTLTHADGTAERHLVMLDAGGKSLDQYGPDGNVVKPRTPVRSSGSIPATGEKITPESFPKKVNLDTANVANWDIDSLPQE